MIVKYLVEWLKHLRGQVKFILLFEKINLRFTNAQGNTSYTIIKNIEKNDLYADPKDHILSLFSKSHFWKKRPWQREGKKGLKHTSGNHILFHYYSILTAF